MSISRSGGCAILCAAVIALTLGGCRESEQGRVLWYEKGTYKGPAQTGLDAKTSEALRSRAANQSFSGSLTLSR